MTTVKELIDQLSKLDPDLQVYYDDGSYEWCDIASAEVKEIYAHELDPSEHSSDKRLTIVQLH